MKNITAVYVEDGFLNLKFSVKFFDLDAGIYGKCQTATFLTSPSSAILC